MRTLMRISTAALLCIGAASAVAQNYPERPIRMVVPFPAGGARTAFHACWRRH